MDAFEARDVGRPDDEIVARVAARIRRERPDDGVKDHVAVTLGVLEEEVSGDAVVSIRTAPFST